MNWERTWTIFGFKTPSLGEATGLSLVMGAMLGYALFSAWRDMKHEQQHVNVARMSVLEVMTGLTNRVKELEAQLSTEQQKHGPFEDVTSQVHFGDNDGESLPLTRCVCGADFQLWEEILSIYEDRPWACPKCGAKLHFRVGITVFAERTTGHGL